MFPSKKCRDATICVRGQPQYNSTTALIKASFVGVAILVAGKAFAGTSSLWERAGRYTGMHPVVVYSICMQESGVLFDDGKKRPYELTINSPEGPKRFKSLNKAEAYLDELLTRQTNVDIGLCQINWRHMGYKLTRNPRRLLDKKFNIEAASSILRECMDRVNDEQRCVAQYHNPDREIGGRYARSVYKIAMSLTGRKRGND